MRRLSSRLPPGREVTVDLEGESIQAFEGEPVACSLLAAGVSVFSRSIKYHRPRGPFSSDEPPGLENLVHLSGFVGHGFMMAPAVAERMAEWMVHENGDDLFTRFNFSRFAHGPLGLEEDMIIG